MLFVEHHSLQFMDTIAKAHTPSKMDNEKHNLNL